MTVVRGKLGVLTPRPPDLERVALVVEVDHHTAYADGTVKYSRYAERRIPVYWLIKAKQQIVLVFDTPQGAGAEAHYARTQRYSGDAEVPIVLDGQEVGRVAASELFPVPESP